jgi:AcrR family transcriptional regulator
VTSPPARGKESRHRRERMSAAVVRDKMLAAAHELISASGVTISVEALSMEDLIRRAGVPRSSVYRIWPYKGDFVDDLLCHMAGPDWFGSGAFRRLTLDLADKIVFDHQDMLGTIDGRRAVALEAIRQATLLNLHTVAGSHEWRINVALVATARFVPDEEIRATIETTLGETEKRFVAVMADFYARMCRLLGLRLRSPSYRYEHLALAGASLVQGIALRQLVAQGSQSAQTGHHGRPGPELSLLEFIDSPLPGPALAAGASDWSFAAVALVGIMDVFTEPDPSYAQDRGKVPGAT